LDQKITFIQNCHQRLNTPGYFILVDGVAMEQETRDQWLQRLIAGQSPWHSFEVLFEQDDFLAFMVFVK